MCGLAGRFHPIQLPADPGWAEQAGALLAHRGPDGQGSYVDEHCELVHRRLALIDLSPTGHQPMANENGSIYVVHNGEIYNHRELRAELSGRGHIFRGTSDTEVLVHLYEQHGVEMVAKLRGMFAFAIYDREQRQIFLARDRFGIKPLYYAALPDQFVFASEIKTILALNNFAPGINRQACYDFLGLCYIAEPQTGFAEIQALPQGHSLVVSLKGPQVTKYHQVQAYPDQNLLFSEAIEDTSRTLLDSVKSQSVADVPVAALLSGGIDSSLVVAAYSQTSEKPPPTFNVSFPDQDYDETPFARAVSDRYRTAHRTISLADFSITPELVRKLLLHFDQPFADSSLIPTYFVSKAIRAQGIICALSGDGGDEAFGGYACFWRANRLALMMNLPNLAQTAAASAGDFLAGYTRDAGRQLAKAFRLTQEARRDKSIMLAGLSNYLSEEQKRELASPELSPMMKSVYRLFADDTARDRFGRVSDLEEISGRLTETLFTVSLTSDMLRKVDMMSMLAGIEVRVPLLDEAVVSCGLKLPHCYKTDGKSAKLVLREIAKLWLPKRVASHRKQGFRIPLDRMATKQFHEMLADLLLCSSTRVRAVLNLPLIEQWLRNFRQAQSGRHRGAISREGLYQRILMALALELWLREHKLSW
jgi:asparagine synthase (glutamine-hydrolysing)